MTNDEIKYYKKYYFKKMSRKYELYGKKKMRKKKQNIDNGIFEAIKHTTFYIQQINKASNNVIFTLLPIANI